MTAEHVQQALQRMATSEKAKASAWFFKTGKGQYGEGDQFIGVTVPEQRKVVRQFRDLPLSEIAKLLDSPIHEHRLTGLLILVGQYQLAKGDDLKRVLVDFYLDHRARVNNWDLVDTSAPSILGDWLLTHDRRLLYQLARSTDLWERRIAIITTYAFIRAGGFDDALKIAEQLLADRHDLIHKAVGWMLREVGNRDGKVLRQFLDQHAATMPRTMLRYAIEKCSPPERQRYLAMKD